jgi:hypothetical protein
MLYVTLHSEARGMTEHKKGIASLREDQHAFPSMQVTLGNHQPQTLPKATAW